MIIGAPRFPCESEAAYARIFFVLRHLTGMLLELRMNVFLFCGFAALTVVIAFPETSESRLHRYKTPMVLTGIAILILCIFVLPGPLKASPDIPYITPVFRKMLLGAMAGATVILGAATSIRMIRRRKGQNGALIVGVALLLVALFGIVWIIIEPMCRQQGSPGEEFPKSCPLPAAFDHNAMLTVLMLVANALAAEGALRLMQAGDGIHGYTSIQA